MWVTGAAAGKVASKMVRMDGNGMEADRAGGLMRRDGGGRGRLGQAEGTVAGGQTGATGWRRTGAGRRGRRGRADAAGVGERTRPAMQGDRGQRGGGERDASEGRRTRGSGDEWIGSGAAACDRKRIFLGPHHN